MVQKVFIFNTSLTLQATSWFEKTIILFTLSCIAVTGVQSAIAASLHTSTAMKDECGSLTVFTSN